MAQCLDWGNRFPDHPQPQRKGSHAASVAISSTTMKSLPWTPQAQISSGRWGTVGWCEGRKDTHCRQPRPTQELRMLVKGKPNLPNYPYTLSELFGASTYHPLQPWWQVLGRASDGPWSSTGVWGRQGSGTTSALLPQQEP